MPRFGGLLLPVFALAAASCGTSATTSRPPQPAQASAAAPRQVPPCPRVSTRPRPAVRVFTSATEAEASLHFPGGTKLADHAEAAGRPYSVLTFIEPTQEGDRGSYVPNAVFPRGAKLVVARDLATNTTARPTEHCSHVDEHVVVALRFAGAGDRVGHFRVLREGVTDTPTLPPRTTGDCAERITYRIEDYFLDLELGGYLAVYDQVFEDSVNANTNELPGVAFDSFVVDGETVGPGICR